MTTGTSTRTDLPVVRALLDRRLDTVWRLRARAVVLGWLVLMTIWGYGRARTGQVLGPWLWMGLTAGGVTTAIQWRTVSRRVRVWRQRRETLASECIAASRDRP